MATIESPRPDQESIAAADVLASSMETLPIVAVRAYSRKRLASLLEVAGLSGEVHAEELGIETETDKQEAAARLLTPERTSERLCGRMV
jgi:hypothetical protein